MKNNINLNLFIRNALCILLSLYVALWPVSSISQTATLLPNGMQQFFDNNGNPLSSGTVDFYIPNTLTRKNTWTDSAETILNTNPVVLDAAGRAIIYGDGSYRQILKDSSLNLIWDKVVSSFASGNTIITTGDGDVVGTIKPWAGILAPSQYAFANGQEILRSTFPALFTAITQTLTVSCTTASPIVTGVSDTTQIPIGAKIELTCVPPGTTVTNKTSTSVTLSAPANVTLSASAIFFAFGNGNGSTTFNLPDLRGYVIAGRSNMGGTPSTNLTATFFGNTPAATGATGGNQSITLTNSNLPAYTPTGTVPITDPGHTHIDVAGTGTGGGNFLTRADNIGNVNYVSNSATTGITATFTGVAQGGTSVPFSTVQPTITLNYIIKITPDTSAQQASGVASLGSQVGAITCGNGLDCTGNNIGVNLGTLAGNFSIANFNSGTGASSSTFWRGDGTWGTLPSGSVGFTFATVAVATAATIPATGSETIYIRGFNTAGDAGAGFWTRSVSMPTTTARFQSADLAWWFPSLANGVFPFEIFGAQCGGSGFDNTPAMNKYNSFISVNGQQPTRFQPCSYFHNSAPSAFNTVTPYFQGTGINATVLMRNYNGSAGVGFLNMTAASGLTISNLEIGGNSGTSTGDALRFDANSSNGSSGSYLQNVTIAGFGTDNFQNMVTIDGHLKVTGAIGSRDHNWIAVTIFGSATSAVNGLSVEGWTWNGGGVYPAGGTSNAPILLNGLTAPMASNVVNVNIAEGGDISLDQCVRCILRSSAWSNTINTSNTNLSGIGGNVPGTKQTNWTNSNYLAF